MLKRRHGVHAACVCALVDVFHWCHQEGVDREKKTYFLLTENIFIRALVFENQAFGLDGLKF